MKAPDKIYIGIQEDGFIDCGIQQTSTCPNEYICKDALMDYFHKRVEDLNSPLNGVFGSTEREHCNERISELLLLIDKLNLM